MFDVSLRLKVQNDNICEYAVLQMEYVSMHEFPPEVLLQSDSHLLEAVLVVLNGTNEFMANQCLHFLLSFVERLTNSLRLRCDLSMMTHPASKFIRGHFGNLGDDEDLQYPNDFSFDLVQNRLSGLERDGNDRFEAHNALQCISISEMASKLITVCCHKLLLKESTKFTALRLMERLLECLVDWSDSSHSSDSNSVHFLVLHTLRAFTPWLDSVDIAKEHMLEDMFTVQSIHFLVTKCLSLCPKQYRNPQHLPLSVTSSLNATLCAFASNIKLSALFPDLHAQIVAALEDLEPATNRKMQYVGHVLKALDLSTFDNLKQIRSTLIALPFSPKMVGAVISRIFKLYTKQKEQEWQAMVSMLLLSPSSHITLQCLNGMVSHLRTKGRCDGLLSVDVVYILLTIIPKHPQIRSKVQNVLELLFTNYQHQTIPIYRRLYPLMSLVLSHSSLESILAVVTKNEDISIMDHLRLCFHSESKVRSASHRKISDFYISWIISEAESEEKRSRPQHAARDRDERESVNVEQERARMDQLARISKFDFFHYDDIRKCAHKYQSQNQKKKASLKKVQCSTFEQTEVAQMVSVLSNDALSCNLRISAGDQLLTIFSKDRRFWNLLRGENMLRLLLRGVVAAISDLNRQPTDSNEALVVVLMEMLKLRFESSVLLDSSDCAEDRYEQILRRLLPAMFASNLKIRYLFSCIASIIAFHPKLLLSQSARSAKSVQREKECYSPKLVMVYTDRESKDAFSELFHLWIPKFVSSYIYLLLPQHKIRWTPYFTRSFEHILHGVDGEGETVDANELYSQNEKIKEMVEEHLALQNEMESKGISRDKLKEQFEAKMAEQILSALEGCKSHCAFIQHVHHMMALFGFSGFLQRFCCQPKFYSVLQRFGHL